jgi:YbbR domain-containing protein
VAKASVNDATTVVTESLPLKAIDKNGKELSGITVSPAVVDVVVPIGLPLKEVPVKPIVNGQPPEGYTMGAIQVDPLTVKVVGPKDILDKLEFISTEPIDISKADADISKDLRLVLPEQVTVSAPSPEKVKVVVRISKSTSKPPTTGSGTPTTPPTTTPPSGTTPP